MEGGILLLVLQIVKGGKREQHPFALQIDAVNI